MSQARRLWERLIYPPRLSVEPRDLTRHEIEAWVEASGEKHFEALDRALVDRARNLGVDRGMMLDLGSPLGLIPLKILWEEEDLLCMGVYRTLGMAEQAQRTAEEWNLGDRMFFQVGDPSQMRFKSGYFDIVVADGVLHSFQDPTEALSEIHRIAKTHGGILLRELRRPNRLQLSGHLGRHGASYSPRLRNLFEIGVRAGFTPAELVELARRAGMERVRVFTEETHVILERRGTNDPASWVSEREKYF